MHNMLVYIYYSGGIIIVLLHGMQLSVVLPVSQMGIVMLLIHAAVIPVGLEIIANKVCVYTLKRPEYHAFLIKTY